MAATDKFIKVGNPGSATSLAAPGYTIGDGTITVVSTTNWPAGPAGCVFAIDVIGADGLRVDGTYNVYQGTVATATSITNVSHISGTGTNRNYSAGTTTRVYIVVAGEIQNRLVEGLMAEHNKEDGTHKNITTDTIVTTGNVTIGGTLTIGGTGSGGYDPITGTVTAVTNNGNRSYSLTTSDDNTGIVSPGMRLRTTRTVAAPTQCTSLNGTTQYYSKTSPSGMTFTDDFVAGAWVKLSSYQVSAVISRVDATTVANGWELQIGSDGRVALIGRNAGNSNYSFVQSYQSLPLNKWVFVAAQLDMSAFTATPTTSYITFDGVDVPASVTRAGTNPTSLVQSGNLNIGAIAGGAEFFPGKIAQAFVSSAKITQANVRTLMSQGLTPALISAHSIISAYSFDNSITDLNTTSANNLTAQGSAVATNADSPFGGQGDGTISSTLDYGIVQAVSASTITVQVAEGCTIPTSGGVSAVSYSTQKVPYNFPTQEGKWELLTLVKTDTSQSTPVTGTWYNLGQKLAIPVGEWNRIYEVNPYAAGSGVAADFNVTLSTANNSEVDTDLSARIFMSVASGALLPYITRQKPVSLSASTDYFLNIKASQAASAVTFYGSTGTTKIIAKNAYL